MSSFLLGVPGRLKTLLDRLTDARAARLDADISSRMPGSTTQRDRIDTTISSRAPSSDTDTLLARLTATRASRLDADISSRASGSQASTIESKVDAIPTSPIKSIQTGVLSFGPIDSTTDDVTISSVNTGKSVVLATFANNVFSGELREVSAAVYLTSSTNLRLEKAVDRQDIIVAWQVVEFN